MGRFKWIYSCEITKYEDTNLLNKCLHTVEYSIASLMLQYLWIGYSIYEEAKLCIYLIKPSFSLYIFVLTCDLWAVSSLDSPVQNGLYQGFHRFGSKLLTWLALWKTPSPRARLQSLTFNLGVCCWKFSSFLQCIRKCCTSVFCKEKVPGGSGWHCRGWCGNLSGVHDAVVLMSFGSLCAVEDFPLTFFLGPACKADVLIVRQQGSFSTCSFLSG